MCLNFKRLFFFPQSSFLLYIREESNDTILWFMWFMWSVTAAIKTGMISYCLIMYCVILKIGLHTFDNDALIYQTILMG